MTSRRRTGVGTLAGLAAAALLVSGCGEDSEPADDPTPSVSEPGSSPPAATTTAEPAGTSVEVTINGDDVSPVGKAVEITPGETLTLNITSDRAGELHVHSSPEQEKSFPAGKSTVEVALDRPGQVDIEEHDSETLILRVLVR